MALDDPDRVGGRGYSVARCNAAVDEQPVLLGRAPFFRELALGRLAIPFHRVECTLRQHEGVWIGWPGAALDDYRPFEVNGLQVVPIEVGRREVEYYYEGMSNATLWPLYHDVISAPRYHRHWWDTYVDVNRRFALAIRIERSRLYSAAAVRFTCLSSASTALPSTLSKVSTQ